MTDLSAQQLQSLTDAITERLSEFELPDGKMPTKGVVRVAYEVITAHLAKRAPEEKPEPKAKTPVHSNGTAKQAISESAVTTLGPEHTIVTPLRSEVGNEVATAHRQAEFDAVIGEMKRMSMGGVMPRMSTWDAARPAKLPKAQAIINRYQMGWKELAEVADLRMEKRATAIIVARNGDAS